MNAIRHCQVIYTRSANGVEGQCTNFNLGTHSADTTDELIDIFREKCSEFLCVDKNFISIQLNMVRKL